MHVKITYTVATRVTYTHMRAYLVHFLNTRSNLGFDGALKKRSEFMTCVTHTQSEQIVLSSIWGGDLFFLWIYAGCLL